MYLFIIITLSVGINYAGFCAYLNHRFWLTGWECDKPKYKNDPYRRLMKLNLGWTWTQKFFLGCHSLEEMRAQGRRWLKHENSK